MSCAPPSSRLPVTLATIALSELREMLDCDESTVRRNLRKRGIEACGHRVPLAELRAKWKALFDSILILHEAPAPGCPSCGSPTHRVCVSCDFTARA